MNRWLLLAVLSLTSFHAYPQGNHSARDCSERLSDLIAKLTPLGIDKDQYFVRSFYQDRAGFTWIGLQNSVLRFDGVAIEEYAFHPASDTGMLKTGPDRIVEDPDGNIWMASWSSGLAVFEAQTQRIRRIRSRTGDPQALSSDEISDIFVDRSGIVWVTTRDFILHAYDHTRGTFRRYPCQLPGLASAHQIVRPHFGRIAPDSRDSSLLWIGSQFGVFAFDKLSGRFDYIRIDTFVTNRYEVYPSPLYVDKLGQLWFGHYNQQGVKVLDLRTRQWIRRYASTTEFDLSEGSNRVFHIFPYGDSLVLAGTWWNHLILINLYDLDDYSIQPYYPYRKNTLGMDVQPGRKMVLIGLDSEILYATDEPPRFGFFYFGQFLKDSEKGNFQTDLLYDPTHKEYLISTRGGDGILRLSEDMDAISVVRYKSKPGFEHLDVDFLAMSRDGDSVWLASSEGLLNFDLSAGVIRPAFRTMDKPDMRLRSAMTTLARYESDLWLCFKKGGIARLDADRNIDMTLFPEYVVTKLHFLNDSICCAATQHGFQMFNVSQENRVTDYTDDLSVKRLSEFEVWDFEQNSDTLWIGTQGNGLARMTGVGEGRYQTRFFISDSDLGSNNINGVLVTDDHQVWTASDYGISYLDVVTGELENFGRKDGIGFSPRGPWLMQLRNGMICVSANQGFHTFYPDSVRSGYRPVTPYLRYAEVLGKRVTGTLTDGMRLKADDDHVAFHMGALNSNGPTPSNSYRYMLEGYDNQWIVTYSESVAKYTNLPGGAYTFRFTASPKGSRWSNAVVSVSVKVAYPFVKSPFFKILMLCAIGTIGFLTWRFIRLRRREKLDKLRKESQLLFLQKEHAEAELTALRAQMNPHFLFNSLNSINWFIVKEKPKIASEYIVKFSRLVRLILEHSKAELISLEEEIESLNLYISLEAMRFEASFQSRIEVADAIDAAITALPPLVIQPFVENAIWHGLLPKTGEKCLTIRIYPEANMLHIEILDNGVGRAQARADRPKFHSPSQGITITRKRIERLVNGSFSGKLSIEDLSENGTPGGTRVHVALPLISLDRRQ